MKVFYFVGGPGDSKAPEFFERLAAVGGTPPGWTIYPHADRSSQALHLIQADTNQEILDHLAHFEDIYRRGQIIEIQERSE